MRNVQIQLMGIEFRGIGQVRTKTILNKKTLSTMGLFFSAQKVTFARDLKKCKKNLNIKITDQGHS